MKHLSRLATAAISLAVLAVPFGASAHTDTHGDGTNDSLKRCDTYYRPGHADTKYPNGSSIPENQRRSDHHTDEFDTGQVGPLYIHSHTGHYGVRHNDFYIEVVGGSGFNRDGNQGGWVQGEVDRSEVPADVDFHANAFAGTEGAMHSEAACLSVADNRVGNPGTRPSMTGPDGHLEHVHLLAPDGTVTEVASGHALETGNRPTALDVATRMLAASDSAADSATPLRAIAAILLLGAAATTGVAMRRVARPTRSRA